MTERLTWKVCFSGDGILKFVGSLGEGGVSRVFSIIEKKDMSMLYL